ncbi:base excision DNA repair protein [Lophiostoma macrostomum CBS 122681]|uniref:Base excision DNA repair protein n=1 Tax=Lophiostoma macrostomum CBS 122681 TaxID=1314788 RepID=A0A6A6T6Z3_9PLEO|nr:base excision DNA repair protein [Lophiostoma macrostomum CBS 122681]
MTTRATRGSARLAAQPSTKSAEPVQLSSPPATPGPQQNSRKRKALKVEKEASKESTDEKKVVTPKSSRKRARTTAIKDEDVNELPHNLGKVPVLTPTKAKARMKRSQVNQKAGQTLESSYPLKQNQENVDDVVTKSTTTPRASPKKGKNNSYGLTPGQTPYPNWPHPTAEECAEVVRLLSTVHGEVKAPKTIPIPSLNISGCGEVPSVLDALIRTRLSAATSGTNSSRAFAGLVTKFGILQEGVGKGSVDWNKVRLADTKDVFEAIKSGGLAAVKSKDIKEILQMVWEENQERRAGLVSSDGAPGSNNEGEQEKDAEVAKAEENVLSLDHLHLLSTDDAFNALVKYPGIGPKTASCVLLFCLQRPSFAVDTHVFRLSTWLGWVPLAGDPAGLAPGSKGNFAGPTRNSTYAHLDVRIPDNLKYPLHQLFIKHGKTCPRCRAITGENSEGWQKGCVIDHLVKRSGVRKGTGASPVKGRNKANKKRKVDDESDEESDVLSDLVSDEEFEEQESDFSAN